MTLSLQIPTLKTMKATNTQGKADKHEKIIISAFKSMKKAYYLLMILPLILMSCESTPEAKFNVDTTSPVVGQDVYFTNESDNATRFEWDFGDGYGSSDPDPVHYYTASGSYEAELTAFSKSGLSDKAYITIDVLIPTLLEIEVVEWYDEYVVENASVRLYPALVDWENEENMEAEGFTDEYGIVVFSHLGPYVYYVDVWEQNHNNYQLASEDIGFIRTGEIRTNKINRFIAWVDYVESTKDDGIRGRTMVIKKLERKPDSKTREMSDTAGWEELYEKSIKVK